MSVHYKFKAAKEYDTLPIDGLHISLFDLKDAIIHQKRLGKFACDLKVTNAETKQVYIDDKDLIPKNTSLIIARIPIDPALRKFGDAMQEDKELLLSNPDYRMNTEGAEEAELIQRKIEEVPDITKLTGTEDEKIAVMMAQSTIKYHPSRYLRLRNTVMSGIVPAFYKCYKCHQGGHWVSNCPLNSQDVRKCTGIPSKFLEEVSDPSTPGVMITASGKYVILRQKTMAEVKAKIRPKFIKPPDDLLCPICKDILKEAVLIACCANAYCDDCIRIHLLESDLQKCPACNAEGIGPDTLIPNRYLRLKVEQFGLQYVIDDDENQLEQAAKPDSYDESPKAKHTESKHGTPQLNGADDDIEVIVPDRENTIKDLVDNDTTKKKVDEEVKIASEVTPEVATVSVPDGKVKTKAVKKKKEKKNKKEKRDKKSKKDKKDKKEKKEKKKKAKAEKAASAVTGEKDISSENLMNEAICPTVDTSIPPPTFSQYGSTNLYDNLGRPDAAIPYGSKYKREIEDTLSPFLDFLRKKDEEKKRKARSPSPGTRYRSSRSRSRELAGTYKRDPGSKSRSSSLNRSRSRSRPRGNSPYSKRSRRYTPEKQPFYAGYKENREMPHREYNPYQTFPLQEEHFGSEYMDHARYQRNPEVAQQYHRGFQQHRFQDNSRQFAGYGQQAYHNYQVFEQPEQLREQHEYRRKMNRDYYNDSRINEARHFQRGRHFEEGYRPREKRYGRSKSPSQERSKDSPNRQYKSKEDYERKHGYSYGEHRRSDDYRKKSKYSSSPEFHHDDGRKSNGEDGRSDRDKQSRIAHSSKSPGKDVIRKRSKSPHKESTSKKGRTKESSRSKTESDSYGKRTRSPSETVSRKKQRTPIEGSPHEKNISEQKKDKTTNIRDTKTAAPLKDEHKTDKSKHKDDKDSKKSKKKKKEKKKKEKVKHKTKVIEGSCGRYDESKNDRNSQESHSPDKSSDFQPNPAAAAYLPELSKWERDDEDTFSPKKLAESSKDKEPALVTSDVLKKAENVLFSKGLTSRNLVPRKVFSDLKTDLAGTSEREKFETRETKKKGSSIQITISSKTESQIGKPKPKLSEQTEEQGTKDKKESTASPDESKSTKIDM